MSSLLEEAIVDAKALKEAALKNAENAVLEKYSSEVKDAIGALLEQEMDDTVELNEQEAAPSTDFMNEIPYAHEGVELDGPGAEEIVEIDFDALKQRIAEDDEVVEGDEMIDATALADEVATMQEGGMNPDIAHMEDDEDVAEETAALASLEEDEEINLSEELISDLIEELVVDMTPRPQGWSSVNSADNSIEQANNDAMSDALDAHPEEEEIEDEERTAPDVVSDAELYEAKISQITESNRELRALIMEAKTQLNQLNLENAKLVYQNKALNSASLNERQKNQIAEAVQTANSVEEAAMIFETIQNAVGSTPDQRTRPQTLREAVTRPTSLLINSKKNNTATRDSKMDRMLRLAGLNK